MKCWGFNDDGQLGYENMAPLGDGPSEMGDNLSVVSLGTGRTASIVSNGDTHTCAILDDNTVKCWGFNTNGQLGLGDVNARGDGITEMGDNLPTVSLGTGRTATQISAGFEHTCAILDNATVKCWGSGGSGRNGTGDGLTYGRGRKS